LVDDLLLRRIARSEGLEVVGVLGLFVQAAHEGYLTKEDALGDIETLINRDGMRISLALYRRVLGLLLG
jgi:predicted nucleic acid-binding protein